jgi:hypothetical protein
MKKTFKLMILIIIILLIVLIGVKGIIAYNDKKTKELLNDPNFTNIYDVLKSYSYTMSRENGIESFTADELVSIAALDLTESDFEETTIEGQSSYMHYYILKESTLINNLKKYFGSLTKIEIGEVSTSCIVPNVNFSDGNGMEVDQYDASKGIYIVRFDGIGDNLTPKVNDRKIIKVKRHKNTITIIEKAIYYEEKLQGYASYEDYERYYIYSDPDKQIQIDIGLYDFDNEKVDFSIDQYLDEASTITTTFKKDKSTGNYYFESSTIESNS